MRIAIYARVSTKDQSCELQVRDLRAYCTARGFDLVREYVDVGQSGAKDSRPELNKLMDDARKRQFDAIVVWRFYGTLRERLSDPEEAKLDRDCIGKDIAAAHHCKYCNLTMPWEERFKAGVKKDYDGADETRKAAYKLFESFMFDQVQRSRGSAKSIIVISGSYHV